MSAHQRMLSNPMIMKSSAVPGGGGGGLQILKNIRINSTSQDRTQPPNQTIGTPSSINGMMNHFKANYKTNDSVGGMSSGLPPLLNRRSTVEAEIRMTAE